MANTAPEIISSRRLSLATTSTAYGDMNSLRWIPGATPPAFTPADLMICLYRLREPLYIIRRHWGGELGLATGGHLSDQPGVPFGEGCHVAGILPALAPESLGESSFCETHGLRYAYIAGEMANGISTAHMVSAMARAGMLGFFGAAGLEPDVIEDVVVGLRRELGELRNWGVNVIHVPGRPDREEQVVDLLLRRGVVNISASAFVHLTPALVRCAVHGLRTDPSGQIVRRVHLFAKVSRPEVATFFMSPPPEDMLRMLVERGHITEAEATLGARIPLADNITVEADSGGHTDNRPLVVALPTILALRDELSKRFGYADPIYVGAAGGLGTPSAVAAAFTLGADYVLTGSINQLAIEAGISATAKELLATADLADVAMAPSADMFELGVKVQVLRRGTFFAARAGQLYEVYRSHPSIEAIPHEIRTKLETQVLHASFDHIWQQTTDFWHKRDPEQLAAARRNPKYRMALIFRWYLGMSSRWAIDGSTARRGDYQLWCGPAAGAFNRWVSESFLADPSQRSVVQIARNLMEGAAVVNRAHQLRVAGVALPTEAFRFVPRLLDVSA